jgi:hypothetical protein
LTTCSEKRGRDVARQYDVTVWNVDTQEDEWAVSCLARELARTVDGAWTFLRMAADGEEHGPIRTVVITQVEADRG